ncbi:hypothetical protein PsorP6_013318 [Peronosclerospora sorghi]|uniref:Uncharacterized protein n=1 Tax=Peronosclerospora sorghi TaxID=230839 RepID=A0ACC0WFV6_9STRA|nr:hypothetical protein PsorP6_013318 [Peronosclerospora sorghi]
MRIDLILLLASSAHLTRITCLAVAAGSEYPITSYKAKFESADGNRHTSIERSLRVRTTMDEEDEERGRFTDFVKELIYKVAKIFGKFRLSD